MTKYIDDREAAETIGVELPYFRKLCRSSDNPPPYLRPTSRKMLFDREALLRWQQTTWKRVDGGLLRRESGYRNVLRGTDPPHRR